MAAASTQKLQDIVECPICLETLTEPRMFGCFHFYCQNCVHEMREIRQSSTMGYKCPLCRKFTATDKLQSLPIMTQLMEAINSGVTEGLKCGRCKTETLKYRCLDCKENYCQPCRFSHDEFKPLQHHRWETISDSAKPILDEIEYCSMHPSKPAELHCRDCNQLICLLCNGTTHKQHTAETIEEALELILPQVEKGQLKVRTNIATTKAAIVKAKEKLDQSKDDIEGVEKNVTSYYQKLLNRLEGDYKEVLRQIKGIKDRAVASRETRVKQLELQLQSQENVLSLSQSTLDTAQNISLLKALQYGVLDSLSASQEDEDTLPEVDETAVVYNGKLFPVENLLGSVHEKPLKNSCELDNCNNLAEKRITLESDNNLGINCRRFEVINDQLWCPQNDSNNIYIYSTEAAQKKVVTSHEFGKVRSVVEFNERALISTSKGLFTVSTDQCHDVKKGYDRNFCDASVRKASVYALTSGDSSKICTLRFNGKTATFRKESEFQVRHSNKHSFNTIQATSNHVFVGHYNKHVIQQYTFDGQLVHEYGKDREVAGDLNSPVLSGCDVLNNVLVASENNNLSVVKSDGTINALPVTGLDQNVMCVRMLGGKLYVLLRWPQNIKVFTIE